MATSFAFLTCMKSQRVLPFIQSCCWFSNSRIPSFIPAMNLSPTFKDICHSLRHPKPSKSYLVKSHIYNIKELRLPMLDSLNFVIENPVSKPRIEEEILHNLIEKLDPLPFFRIQEPEQVIEKHAVTMIVIRRRKMRKHRLKKLRKRMKFVWAKRTHRREVAKELLFQTELVAKIREAEAFDPVKYVRDTLTEYNEVPIPTTWKGRVLPKEVIKNLIEDPLYYHYFKYPYYRTKKLAKK